MNWKAIALIAITATVAGPVITNVVMSYSTPLTYQGDWLSFFGNYLGSIVGLISGFIIFTVQTKKQHKADKRKEKEMNRSYILAHEFFAHPKLHGVKTNENSRIIQTEYYDDFLEFLGETIDKTTAAFYKITQYGNADIILDCRVNIKLSEPNGINPFHIESRLGVLTKQEEVFIPLSRKDLQKVELHEVTIEYQTLAGEKIRYKHNVVGQKEHYEVVKKNGNNVPLFEFESKVSNWIYPNKNEL